MDPRFNARDWQFDLLVYDNARDVFDWTCAGWFSVREDHGATGGSLEHIRSDRALDRLSRLGDSPFVRTIAADIREAVARLRRLFRRFSVSADFSVGARHVHTDGSAGFDLPARGAPVYPKPVSRGQRSRQLLRGQHAGSHSW